MEVFHGDKLYPGSIQEGNASHSATLASFAALKIMHVYFEIIDASEYSSEFSCCKRSGVAVNQLRNG